MKFKLERIEGIYIALIEICKRSDIIAKTSYWLGKFKNKVESEYKIYQTEEGKLRDKYGAWKYRLEKDVPQQDGKPGKDVPQSDKKPVKDVQILTLKGSEHNKHWENEQGEKVEFTEPLDKRKIYWQGNSDEDSNAFREELKSLHDQEFEIPYEPIKLSRIIGGYGSELAEIVISGEIMAELDGIIVDDEPVKEEAAA